jgi:hypothetical protein
MDADVNNVPENLQMEVIELQADLVLNSQQQHCFDGFL